MAIHTNGKGITGPLVHLKINMTVATSEAGTANPSEASEFTPGFYWVRATRSLVLCVCFVDCCLYFSFGHSVICSSSIYIRIMITPLVSSNSP